MDTEKYGDTEEYGMKLNLEKVFGDLSSGLLNGGLVGLTEASVKALVEHGKYMGHKE